MKHLPLKTPAFIYVEKSFKEWLDILGYSAQTVYALPVHVREFLFYLEQKQVIEIKCITINIMKEYYHHYLKTRCNQLYKSGSLSNSYLNKHLQALTKFTDYLRQSGRLEISVLNIRKEETKDEKLIIVTQEEIKQLFTAAEQYPAPHERVATWLYEALALRDKAMLTIFYGCGLRRNEALHLSVSDIYFEKEFLHVRNGKGNKERFTPVTKTGLQHLENYIYNARPHFLKANKEEGLFISQRGRKTNGETLLRRLQLLIIRTNNIELQEKQIGLHTLRHSIATHLLQNGMSLEKIKDFLGHDSLESTQIYTHLIEKENDHAEQNF